MADITMELAKIREWARSNVENPDTAPRRRLLSERLAETLDALLIGAGASPPWEMSRSRERHAARPFRAQ
jgi:hypothetical protein